VCVCVLAGESWRGAGGGRGNGARVELVTSVLQGDLEPEIPMINVPGQRFTATHGIRAKKGEHKLFL
jgi:hypothetical protein